VGDDLIRKAEYRLVSVETTDYGDGPACEKRVIGSFSRIPDGTHWEALPQSFKASLAEGTRPGAVFELTLQAKDAAQ
jgi:hypothetical protein